MSQYRDDRSRSDTRPRDMGADPVHGQNPDYYAATAEQPPKAPSNVQLDPSQLRPSSSESRRSGDDAYDREELHLEPYDPDRRRPRSLPPYAGNAMIYRNDHRGRSRRSSADSSSTVSVSRSRSRGGGSQRCPPTPIDQARRVVNDNFSHSPAGIGAGLLGAVMGGLVASRASEAANRRRQQNDKHYQRTPTDNRARMLTTLAGAVAGGLGANALTHRVEDRREKFRDREGMWGGDFGRGHVVEIEESRRGHFRSGSRGAGRNRGWDKDDDDYDFVRDHDIRRDRRMSNDDKYYRY